MNFVKLNGFYFYEDKLVKNQLISFFNKINMLLDEMVPFGLVACKEINAENSPLITEGILKSIASRDK